MSLNTSLNKSSEEWTEKIASATIFATACKVLIFPHSSAKECTCHCHQHRDLDWFDSVRARASFFVVIFLSVGCRDWVVRQMVVIQAPLKMSVFF